jgi:hypothetical protein
MEERRQNEYFRLGREVGEREQSTTPPPHTPIMEVTFIFLGNKKITSREMFYLYVRKRHVSEESHQTQNVPCCEVILPHAAYI